jgi:hypothetical protein
VSQNIESSGSTRRLSQPPSPVARLFSSVFLHQRVALTVVHVPLYYSWENSTPSLNVKPISREKPSSTEIEYWRLSIGGKIKIKIKMGRGGEQENGHDDGYDGYDAAVQAPAQAQQQENLKGSSHVHVFHGLDDAARTTQQQQTCLSNTRVRRMIALALLLATGAYFCWSMFRQYNSVDAWTARAESAVGDDGTYGIEKHRVDKNLVRLKNLDENLLPGGKADPKGERRLVFVGDVHGCKKELLKLLRKVDFNEQLDHLVLVGDTISKGPDNTGVLDELIRLNATSVRGNHEDNVLLEARRIAGSVDESESSLPDHVKATRKRAKDRELLKSLKPRHVEYLNNMPLMLHIPSLPQATGGTSKKHSPITEHILVVHAGLVPGINLKMQDSKV